MPASCSVALSAHAFSTPYKIGIIRDHSGNTRASTRLSSTVTSAPSLATLDHLLASEEDKQREAMDLAKNLKIQGVLRAYGSGRQVPKRSYTVEELRLNKIQTTSLLSPEDKSLKRVRSGMQAAFLSGLAALALTSSSPGEHVVAAVAATCFVLVIDQIVNSGGGESLVVDTLGRLLLPGTYKRRVALHEAGHFLTAYLLGLLPRAYTLSAWDAYARYRTLNLQAGTQFCDIDFSAEVATGRLSSASLDTYTCVALAGVITEAERFGQAEGGVGDVAGLDALLRALGFSQAKSDDQVRWAVLNVCTLLRRHEAVHDALADAMDRGAPISECIALIEQRLAKCEDV
mmetsp:Transcript_8407/g.14414  ORF Transcript_8407/g.14414 Transcript_8407/m.14414 type:complete len:345 (+) Transcript_8407:113-1147(+)